MAKAAAHFQEERPILTKSTFLEACNDFSLLLPLPPHPPGSALFAVPERVCALAV